MISVLRSLTGGQFYPGTTIAGWRDLSISVGEKTAVTASIDVRVEHAVFTLNFRVGDIGILTPSGALAMDVMLS